MRTAIVVCLAVLLCATAVWAQSTAGFASISGVVRDPSDAAIPNAQVVITNESKGIRRQLESNDAGVFTAPNLPPAPGYQVTADVAGFAEYVVRDLELLVGQNRDLNIALQVAVANTQVSITAEAPLVEDTKTN